MSVRDILLVEDEAIIAMDLEMTLEARGYRVLGPCRSLDEARAAIAEARPDLAILDVNLGHDETSFALAEELHGAGVPVVFLSGYSANTISVPAPLQDAQRLMKPVDEAALFAMIDRVDTAAG